MIRLECWSWTCLVRSNEEKDIAPLPPHPRLHFARALTVQSFCFCLVGLRHGKYVGGQVIFSTLDYFGFSILTCDFFYFIKDIVSPLILWKSLFSLTPYTPFFFFYKWLLILYTIIAMELNFFKMQCMSLILTHIKFYWISIIII